MGCVLQAASAQGLSVAGNTAVTVLSGGNVGIGTTNPGAMLDVDGDATDIGLRVRSGGNTGFNIADFADVNGDGNVVIDPAGRVGIGTTNPGSKLGVAGVTSGKAMRIETEAQNNAALAISSTNNISALGVDIDVRGRVNANYALKLRNDTTPIMYVNAYTGDVGIGTTNPIRVLHLSDNDAAYLRLSDNTASAGISVNAIVEYYQGENDTRVGFVGFGSSFDSDLEISNAISGGGIEISTSGGGDVTIPNGSVGIGTTDRGALLVVRGNAY